MKPENSLHIKFVLSCMINNVVFIKYDISIRFAQVEQVRFQTVGRRWVERTHYMIRCWRTHGVEWPSSRSVGYYKIHKLIRCLFIHYGSIFQMHDPWPGGFRYVIFLIHIRNPESVLTNDGKVSPMFKFNFSVQRKYFPLRLIKRKIQEKIGKSCLYDNLIIFDLKNGRPSSPDT